MHNVFIQYLNKFIYTYIDLKLYHLMKKTLFQPQASTLFLRSPAWWIHIVWVTSIASPCWTMNGGSGGNQKLQKLHPLKKTHVGHLKLKK